MRKGIKSLGLLAALVATISFATVAKDGKTMTWKGWISESKCGAKGASADHKDCSLKCQKEGASWVFVDTKTKKVYNIHNQDAVNTDQNIGMEVNLTGHTMDDGSVHVDKIAPTM